MSKAQYNLAETKPRLLELCRALLDEAENGDTAGLREILGSITTVLDLDLYNGEVPEQWKRDQR